MDPNKTADSAVRLLNRVLVPARALFLLAFSMSFLWFGSLMMAENSPYVLQWLDARSWVATPAEVLSVKLPRKQGRGVGEGVYRYRFGGRAYVGNNLGLKSGAIRDYHWSVARRMQDAREQGAAIDIWVNPDHPAESIVDRQLHLAPYLIELLFALFFLSVGAFIAAIGLRKIVFSLRYRDIPWRRNPAWQGGPIRPEAGDTLVWLWVMWWIAFIVIVPMSTLFLFLDGTDNEAPFVPFLFMVLYIAYTLFLLFRSWRVYRDRKVRVVLDPFPGQVGGQVAGHVGLGPSIAADSRLWIELKCLYRTRSGGSNNSSRVVHRLLWSERGRVERVSGQYGPSARFGIAIPDNLPQSITDLSGSGPVWALDLRVDQAGRKRRFRFWIPVFRVRDPVPVGASEPAEPDRVEEEAPLVLTPTAAAVEKLHEDQGLHLGDIPLRISRGGGGLIFFYPMYRNPGKGVGGLIAGLVFGGIAWSWAVGLADTPPPPDWVMGLLFAIGIGGIGGAFYNFFNSLELHVGPRGIVITRRLMAMKTVEYRLPRERIASLETQIVELAGDRRRARANVRIKVTDVDGKTYLAGDQLRNPKTADYVVQTMNALLGRGQAPPG